MAFTILMETTNFHGIRASQYQNQIHNQNQNKYIATPTMSIDLVRAAPPLAAPKPYTILRVPTSTSPSPLTLNTIIVDTIPTLQQCISQLAQSTSIAVDVEGINLSRHGRISIIQLYAEGSNTVWLVDVTTLGALSLYHTHQNSSLKTILESAEITKLFFDVRNDADALYNIFGVDMKNVYDVQLLEVAYLRYSSSMQSGWYVSGLAKCVKRYLSALDWCKVKLEGRCLFAPDKGGTYEIFERRPIHPTLIRYCAQDASVLVDLKNELMRRMSLVGGGECAKGWEERVRWASGVRLGISKAALGMESLGKYTQMIAPTF